MLHHLITLFTLLGPALFFGIGMGPSSGEINQANAVGSIGGFGTAEGEADITSADNFWKAILSGDPTQISKVLGPQISAINKQGQQQLKTTETFGNRGGGTNSAAQTTGDATRGRYDSLVSGLTSQAATSLGNSGSNLLSTGLSAHQDAFGDQKTIQEQNEAKWNDIFKGITSVAAAPFTGGASLGFGNLSLPGSGGGGGGSSFTGATNNNSYFDEPDGTD